MSTSLSLPLLSGVTLAERFPARRNLQKSPTQNVSADLKLFRGLQMLFA
jgi:hypothetical protein